MRQLSLRESIIDSTAEQIQDADLDVKEQEDGGTRVRHDVTQVPSHSITREW